MYTALKFIHVASIAVWFGGIVTMVTLNRLLQGEDASVMRALGKQGAALSMRLFGPAALLTVVTGIGMVQVNDLSFGSAWILWGIVGAIVSFVLGGVLTGGTARKLAQQVARGEVDAAGAARVQKRILGYALLNLVLLLSVIWAMVAKPA